MNKKSKAGINVSKTKKKEKPVETHQQAGKGIPLLTTAQGATVSDDQNSLKIGSKGPTLLEDFPFREKIFHFDHERIPERVVHARGYGAHGYFENYQSLAEYTCADLFQRGKEKIPAFVRFSTVVGNKGSADLARDVRGFAVKLYTKVGNWDIVGNNIPVFFIQDAIKFPDLIHAAKDEPNSGFPQAQTAHDNFWDFISLNPESMHMIMWVMSDRALPRSFRFMPGFGIHTFRLVNAKQKSTFVKFHWLPKLGVQSLTWDEAVKLNGADPDFHRRDLWEAIHSRQFPEWELGMQLFDENMAKKFDFDILDPTKLIPEELIPIKKVGRLVLNRCVDNFFAETEQVAFCTQNIIPGIDFSNDPLLQGRNFSYLDTQVKRLGSPNFTQLPINAPKCPFHNFQQDGHMAFYNLSGRANYEPNSWKKAGGPRESLKKGFKSFAAMESGAKLRVRPESFADYYNQAHLFYKNQTPIEQQHIQSALAFELSKVSTHTIQTRVISHLLNIDTELAKQVAHQLGLSLLPKAAPIFCTKKKNQLYAPSLSLLLNQPNTFKGRKLGLILTEKSNFHLAGYLEKLAKKQGGIIEIITPKILNFKDKKRFKPQQSFETAISASYDAIAVLSRSKDLLKYNELKLFTFLQESFHQCKFIAYIPELAPIFKKLHLKSDPGIILLKNSDSCQLFIKHCKKLRYWERYNT
ncbi:MAG: catalase [Gammaproteobacteria bacterium]|nr:MAG: catalase [Gammaproteobacteria bacterium]